MRTHQRYDHDPDAYRHHRTQPQPHHPPPRRWSIDATQVGLALTWMLLGLILGGGGVFFLVPDRAEGGSAAPSALADTVRQALPGDQGAPKTKEAVRAAAQEWMDRAASGDYGGAWDLWIAAAKRTFSRDDYVKFFQLCPVTAGFQGLRGSVDQVTYTPGADTAKVRMSYLIAVFNIEMAYQDGGWRVTPPAEDLAAYRQYPTAEALAEYRRSQDACG